MDEQFELLMSQPSIRAVLQRASRRLVRAGAADSRKDAEQELMLRLWQEFRKRPSQPPMDPVAWATRQVHNHTVNLLRSSRRREIPFGDMQAIVGEWGDHVAETDRRLDIEAVLDKLPIELRELAQDLAAGYTQTEIAAKQGVSRGVIHRRIRVLRRYLESV